MDAVLALLLDRHESLARMVRRAIEQLSVEQFGYAPGPDAPPIGWHLWHIARWADRFQASIAAPDAPAEIWTTESLAEAYGLDAAALGILQLGMGMGVEDAQAVPSTIGRERFAVYQERVLAALGAAIASCDPARLLSPRPSIREYAEVNGVLQYAAPQESTLLADILFYLTHSSRHLGNVEALRGL
jgi:hypothetical protein